MMNYDSNPERMHKDVSDRFSVVLKLIEHQQQQQQQQTSAVDVLLDRSIRMRDVPHELRPMVVCYADINTRKSSELYNAYLIAKTISQNVENASNDHDTPESKDEQVKQVYSMLKSK